MTESAGSYETAPTTDNRLPQIAALIDVTVLGWM